MRPVAGETVIERLGRKALVVGSKRREEWIVKGSDGVARDALAPVAMASSVVVQRYVNGSLQALAGSGNQ